jgi:acyl-CoA reductase-like NAD-dependent aldehyde dehydrogenase
MGYIEIGRTEGRLVAGGGRPDGFPTGNYVAPTVFADVPAACGARTRSPRRSTWAWSG